MVARQIAGKNPWRQADRRWYKPLMEEAMRETGLEEMETTIYKRQNKVAKFIST